MTFMPVTLTNPVNQHRRYGITANPKTSKAVLVIIHGFGEHSGRYTHMMKHLADQGIATVAIDLEGHGQSEGKRGVCKSYSILRADVDLTLDHAKTAYPDLPLFIYGHSMGGGLVLNHAFKHAPSVNGFIASAPLIKPAEPVPAVVRFLVKLLRHILPNMTLKNSISGDQVSTVPEEQARYENDPLNHDKLGIGLAVDMIEGGEWVLGNASNWSQPLLLMHATGDQLTDFTASEAFANAAQNCTFMPLDEAEHEIHNDVTRDVVYAAITNFIISRI